MSEIVCKYGRRVKYRGADACLRLLTDLESSEVFSYQNPIDVMKYIKRNDLVKCVEGYMSEHGRSKVRKPHVKPRTTLQTCSEERTQLKNVHDALWETVLSLEGHREQIRHALDQDGIDKEQIWELLREGGSIVQVLSTKIARSIQKLNNLSPPRSESSDSPPAIASATEENTASSLLGELQWHIIILWTCTLC